MITVENIALASLLVDLARDPQQVSAQMRGVETAYAAAAQAAAHKRREEPAVVISKKKQTGVSNPIEDVNALRSIAAVLTGKMLVAEIKAELRPEAGAVDDASRPSEVLQSVSAAASEPDDVAGAVNLGSKLFAQSLAGGNR